ncbi:hypothetical protein DPMN_151040 [Dreissena polymorpha]|uniref:Uncharacterized protein n=1 Tax=Dreissena polymorpha TaxID=45954 RepID=A0A9D4FGU6_DREPO|nr:hypothetical protein DPMN_151040 [Dreissena polymorpha]
MRLCKDISLASVTTFSKKIPPKREKSTESHTEKAKGCRHTDVVPVGVKEVP